MASQEEHSCFSYLHRRLKVGSDAVRDTEESRRIPSASAIEHNLFSYATSFFTTDNFHRSPQVQKLEHLISTGSAAFGQSL